MRYRFQPSWYEARSRHEYSLPIFSFITKAQSPSHSISHTNIRHTGEAKTSGPQMVNVGVTLPRWSDSWLWLRGEESTPPESTEWRLTTTNLWTNPPHFLPTHSIGFNKRIVHKPALITVCYNSWTYYWIRIFSIMLFSSFKSYKWKWFPIFYLRF